MSKSTFWKDVTFPDKIVDFSTIGPQGVILPSGTTLERPVVATTGTLRFNTTIGTTEVYQGGTWASLTTTAVSGETNTASNLGAGQGVYATKVGTDLQFKSLVAGTNVTIGSNATEITINAVGTGEVNTASNVGTGTGTIFDSKLGTDLQFKSLISVNPNLTITNNGSVVEFNFTGGIGEVNSGVNTGGGAEIYRDKPVSDLRFRTIVAAGNEISTTQTVDTVIIGIADDPIIPGTLSVTIPAGPSATEPLPSNGMMRYDTTSNNLKAVVNGAWQTISTASGTWLPLSGGTMTGDITLGGGVNIVGSANSQLIWSNKIVMQAGADIDMSLGGNIVIQTGKTVDGRDISEDGIVLDAVNNTGSIGFITRTADPSSFAFRTIDGSSNQITIIDRDGIAGNPTISITDNPVIGGNESVTIPVGATLNRPATPTDGMVRINSTTQNLEYRAGGIWTTPLTNRGGTVTSGPINMGGFDINNIGLTDGRDLGADGAIIDQLAGITSDTGVVVKSGGSFWSRLIIPSAVGGRLGINVQNGNGSTDIEIGLDINGLGSTAGLALTDTFPTYSSGATTNTKATINDLLTLIGNSGLDAELDVAGEFGFLTRIADGTPGNFARRSVVSDTTVSNLGITVGNRDGVSGNPTIGLDIANLPTSNAIIDSTLIPTHEVGVTNAAASVGQLRVAFADGAFRVSGNSLAITTGVSVIPFAVGAGDFDKNGRFNDATDTYTPVAGTYSLSAYVEVGATSVAGKYTMRIRRNGTAEGNTAVIVADGTNVDSATLNDLFEANGTDSFTVEINNASGSASTLDVVRFYAHRVY